jgi:hypothetical protein
MTGILAWTWTWTATVMSHDVTTRRSDRFLTWRQPATSPNLSKFEITP